MISNHKNRGVATILVLISVATVAIIAWAMLSASQISSQVGTNTSSSRQTYYASESGVSLGVYYLRYPEKAPKLATDKWGYSYYPGQTGIDVLKDGNKVNITVTPLGNDKYKVCSATSSETGASSDSSAVVEVSRMKNVVEHGLMSNGKLDLPSNVIINGPIAAVGQIIANTSQLLGTVLNLQTSNSGSNNTTIVPALSSLPLYTETAVRPSGASIDQRKYTYRGKTYLADKVASSVSGTLKANATTNPCNVWYANDDVTFNSVTLNGTIIVRNKDLKIKGTTVITPVSGMPAVVAAERLDLCSSLLSPSNVTINGVTWVGDRITNSGTQNVLAKTIFNGSLMMANNSPKIEDKVWGTFQINYDKTKAIWDDMGTKTTVEKVRASDWATN